MPTGKHPGFQRGPGYQGSAGIPGLTAFQGPGGFVVAAALAAAAAGCSGNDLRPVLPPGEYVDTFAQVASSKVDVLWVVDNSGSTADKQDNLARNFGAFIGFLTRAQTDYHIGVTTTDIVNDNGKLHGTPPVITSSTPDAAGVFANNVRVGVSGAANECGLEGARRTFLLNPSGFLRPDAYLYIIFVSDEDDHSAPGLPKYYYRFYKGLKGKGNEAMVSAAAIAGDVPGGCDANGGARAATRYMDVVTQMGGRFGSICADDFVPVLDELGMDAAGLKRKFNLSRTPDPATLVVTVHYPCDARQSELQASCTALQNQCADSKPINCVGKQMADGGTDGWTFEASSNTIVFHGAAVPPKGATIDVKYYLPGQAPSP